MAAGIPVTKRVFGHGWWTVEGQKMSKSLGNVITPKALVDKYGARRRALFHAARIAVRRDGDFSHRAMVNRINGDLANDLGNLAQRVLSMVQRYCEGRVPKAGALTEADKTLLGSAQALLPKLRAEYAVPAYHRALDHLWAVVADANRYVDEQAPWALRKSDPARCDTVLYVLAETIRHLGILDSAGDARIDGEDARSARDPGRQARLRVACRVAARRRHGAAEAGRRVPAPHRRRSHRLEGDPVATISVKCRAFDAAVCLSLSRFRPIFYADLIAARLSRRLRWPPGWQ